MFISEIQLRLMDSIGREGYPKYNRALGLALYRGANPDEMTDAYHLALWFEGADYSVKREFLDAFNERNNDLRVCDHCGVFMTEGYLINGHNHACSKRCALQIWGETEKSFDEAVRASVEDDAGETFWTEW
jgi:hypothetical protein